MRRILIAVAFILSLGCTCDQRFLFTSFPCHYDITGCQEMTPCYDQHKAKWEADLNAGRITYAEYRHNLGY